MTKTSKKKANGRSKAQPKFETFADMNGMRNQATHFVARVQDGLRDAGEEPSAAVVNKVFAELDSFAGAAEEMERALLTNPYHVDGMAIDSPNETWKTISLQGRETGTISTVSINPRAVDFRLKFRE